MPCDSVRTRQQTIGERALEVRAAIASLDRALLRRQVKVVVGPQGAIAFTGWNEQERNGVTDACAYRRIMATGSSMAKMEIMRAEQMAGRTVDRSVVNAGVHYHEGSGWHGKD